MSKIGDGSNSNKVLNIVNFLAIIITFIRSIIGTYLDIVNLYIMEKADNHHRQVLLVEDDFLLALDAEDSLASCGNEVVLASSVPEALNALETKRIDCAIMDFNLGDELVTDVADRLKESDIPYAIVSAADRVELKRHLGDLNNVYAKPADYTSIISQVLS